MNAHPPCPPAEAVTQSPRPRTIVTADPELDDANSLIRYLLYSNEVTTEGLVYAGSRFHWKGDGKGTDLAGGSTRRRAA
ncbi:nucleoside hydrolase-like domain-containing protein [Nonomuraea sp. NPDC052116]|uniref:nucleoside hydrolase-like domain-containing protein n=1 Tax=Nonomuraea sp. NPDC052116 TaxID=3155665 RepID=UPI003433ABE2